MVIRFIIYSKMRSQMLSKVWSITFFYCEEIWQDAVLIISTLKSPSYLIATSLLWEWDAMLFIVTHVHTSKHLLLCQPTMLMKNVASYSRSPLQLFLPPSPTSFCGQSFLFPSDSSLSALKKLSLTPQQWNTGNKSGTWCRFCVSETAVDNMKPGEP